MSRQILSVIFALLLIFGYTQISQADVTGSFELDIALIPEGAQTEAVKFDIDFQANLVINITLSGITFGADLGFGVTGVEFAVLSLTTNLGALAVFDQFVFAEPFACVLFTGGSVSDLNTINGGGQLVGQCPGQQVIPIGDGDGDGVIDRAVGFVKKRISIELNIAGISLSNLALFEDVDFPDIQGGNDHEHDHFDGNLAYDLSSINTDVDDQTPTFGFGDVISISGQTVSGITVTGTTAFCASGVNYIKKRNFVWEVNEACTSGFGNGTTPIEGGAKTPLLFEQEDLWVEGIELGGVTLDIHSTFIPLKPINAVITASTSIFDLADVVATFNSMNITNLVLSSVVTTVTSGNLSLTLIDLGGDLSLDQTNAVLSVVLNPNQNPADFVISLNTNNSGLSAASFSLGISRNTLNLDSTTTFSGSGSLSWSSTSFSIDVNGGGGLSFGADFTYTPGGMGPTSIKLGIIF